MAHRSIEDETNREARLVKSQRILPHRTGILPNF